MFSSCRSKVGYFITSGFQSSESKINLKDAMETSDIYKVLNITTPEKPNIQVKNSSYMNQLLAADLWTFLELPSRSLS